MITRVADAALGAVVGVAVGVAVLFIASVSVTVMSWPSPIHLIREVA